MPPTRRRIRCHSAARCYDPQRRHPPLRLVQLLRPRILMPREMVVDRLHADAQRLRRAALVAAEMVQRTQQHLAFDHLQRCSHTEADQGRIRHRHRLAAEQFFDNTVLVAQLKQLTSNEHFSVDGTLLEAWASHKSFRPKDDDSSDDDFRGRPRSNETHESTTDPDARLMCKGKGKEAKLSYQANALMENRNGLLMGVDVCDATGTSERDGALRLIDEMYLGKDCTLGADKGYDTRDFIAALQARGIRPHIARNTAGRCSAISDDIAATAGYAISQQVANALSSRSVGAKYSVDYAS